MLKRSKTKTKIRMESGRIEVSALSRNLRSNSFLPESDPGSYVVPCSLRHNEQLAKCVNVLECFYVCLFTLVQIHSHRNSLDRFTIMNEPCKS